jgi:ABC-type glutathione transport system ATPase component
MAEPLLIGAGLVVSYGGRRGRLWRRAKETPPVLKGVDISIGRGETVGIVGESGSGKSTLGRTLLGLIEPAAGTVTFDGIAVHSRDRGQQRLLRRRMQMIFQDATSALNPRRTIGRILSDPLLLHGLAKNRTEARAIAADTLAHVGLPADAMSRYPHELSGGQRQRVGIARAVVVRPDFVLADEIVSGLDVSTQAQVLRLLADLGREMGLAMALISHDLSVVRSVCQRVYVIYDGAVQEHGACDAVFASPKSAYTQALIDAIPLPVRDPGWLERGAVSGRIAKMPAPLTADPTH